MKFALYVTFASLALAVVPAPAATIWTGPKVTFAKEARADPTLAANQDRLTDNVWITRGNVQGLYNAVSETLQTANSPAGTRWAVGTTADLASLTFSTWLGTVGTTTPIGGPPNAVGRDFVVHLVAEDIYLDLRMLGWAAMNGGGGSFSYERSTAGAVPEPHAALLTLGLSAAAPLRRRRPH